MKIYLPQQLLIIILLMSPYAYILPAATTSHAETSLSDAIESEGPALKPHDAEKLFHLIARFNKKGLAHITATDLLQLFIDAQLNDGAASIALKSIVYALLRIDDPIRGPVPSTTHHLTPAALAHLVQRAEQGLLIYAIDPLFLAEIIFAISERQDPSGVLIKKDKLLALEAIVDAMVLYELLNDPTHTMLAKDPTYIDALAYTQETLNLYHGRPSSLTKKKSRWYNLITRRK